MGSNPIGSQIFSRCHARVTLFSHIFTELQFHHHSFIIVQVVHVYPVKTHPFFLRRYMMVVSIAVVFLGQNFQSSMVICLLRSVTDVKQSTSEGMQ